MQMGNWSGGSIGVMGGYYSNLALWLTVCDWLADKSMRKGKQFHVTFVGKNMPAMNCTIPISART
jgi:hypothetical protein